MTDTPSFFDQGYDLHREQPELMVAQVWWIAAVFITDQENARAFVEGYQAARKHRDDAQAEQLPL